jgi:hypothetical protein
MENEIQDGEPYKALVMLELFQIIVAFAVKEHVSVYALAGSLQGMSNFLMENEERDLKWYLENANKKTIQ